MKVVQINAVYGVGSTGRIVQDISGALTAQGHESHVFWATACRKDTNARLVRVGSTLDHKVHALLRRLDGKQAWHSKAATRKACRQIAALCPDVVHLHNLHSNYIHLPELLRFLGERDIPTLFTLHDNWPYTCGHCTCYAYHACDGWLRGCTACPAVHSRRRKAAERMYGIKQNLFAQIPRLAVNGVSRWTAEDAKRSMLNCAAHIQHIYNWVDTDVFKPQNNGEQIRAKYGVPAHHKLVLGVAQGWSRKGLNEFLLIARELGDTATVLLVGQDEGVPKLPNLRCIGFTSDRQELVELYSAADVFVNPSKAETFGLVTVEAMACGTPVAAFDNSGTGELVAEGCGLLVEDGNAQVLLDAVKSILDSGKASYTEKCRKHVCEHYEKERQLQKYIELYKQIAGMKTTARRENG